MNLLRAVARTVVPPSVKDQLRAWPWRALNLTWKLRSDLKVRLGTMSEWLVYNDIFVDGEYDRPILDAFQAARGRAVRILDLGANLGFFAIRVADLSARFSNPPPDYQVTCIEGSPRNFAELTERIAQSGFPSGRARLVHGLAGERSGEAVIRESSHMNGMNTILRQGSRGASVKFVDIDQLYPGGERIDLLKCDIEGAELKFLENYPGLLKRVERAVFELHPGLCDVERCRALLKEAGLGRCIHLWNRDDTFTDYFQRD